MHRARRSYVTAFLSAAKPTFFGLAGRGVLPQITEAMKGRRSANLLLTHVAAVIELDMGDRAWDSPQSHIRD